MKTPSGISPSSAPLMARVQALVGDSLRRVETIFAEEIASRSPYVREILDHLAGYRGKRMRPMLVLLSGQACGGVREAHCVLAAAIEMIHTATLVHDDILDEATTRRHVATINSRWTNETSVLLGDYLFTHAFHLTSSLGDASACRAIGRATNLVCEGEMSQIGERGNLDLSEETYFDIIEGKTAELCAVACELGARHSGASEEVCRSMDGYGRDLGIAFQIADDLLDVVGNERQTGKTLGSDLEKQKLTLPIIHLLAHSSGAQADRIRDLLTRPGPQAREELLPLLMAAGSLEYARTRAVELTLSARQNLQCLPESPARQLLDEMADFVAIRSA